MFGRQLSGMLPKYYIERNTHVTVINIIILSFYMYIINIIHIYIYCNNTSV